VNALKRDREDDYYKNAPTIEWPLGQAGEPFLILGFVVPAVAFSDGAHVAVMPKLLDQPFWLDPSDGTTWPR
jgi:hypothetical protein